MTLRRQLFWGISLMFFLIFAGVTFQSIHASRGYLRQQLASHAQDAATALAHNLADALARNDRGLADAQVASMFDRGYYQQIYVLSTQGTPLVTRSLPPVIEGVPTWFKRLIHIPTPPGESFLSSGWRQLGRVVVISQPTFAYQYLWKSAVEMSMLMGSAFLISILATHFFLRVILTPLHRIESAAEAICNKDFTPITPLPSAKELRSVVVAMNDASRRISAMLESETSRAEGFRQDAYMDPVTRIANRRSFDLCLLRTVQEESGGDGSILAVLEIDGLKNLNLTQGHPAGDGLLANIAGKSGQAVPDAFMARIGGGSFAFIWTDKTYEDLAPGIKALLHEICQEYSSLVGAGSLSFQIGATSIHATETPGAILARADLAIEMARQGGGNKLERVLEATLPFMGSTNWRTVIDQALSSHSWSFLSQAVKALKDGQVIHHEVFSRIKDAEGRELPAHHVIPMAHRHQFMSRMDKALIEDLLTKMNLTGEASPHFAINISLQAIEDNEFVEWLESQLSVLGKATERLSFELPESAFLKSPKYVSRFRQMLRARGAHMGIDQFGMGIKPLGLLRELKPDYVKLDGGLIGELDQNADTRQVISGIVQVAHALDVAVIAMRVEQPESVRELEKLGVDGGQGFLFGKLTPI